MPARSLEQLVALCKRRGFIFPGSEIYGGLQGTFDYGPLGVELKNNLKAAWWRANVYERDDMEGLDAAIIMNRMTWRYSGHEETFNDPMVDCRNCQMRWRADKIGNTCPNCDSADLTDPRPFNLMFKTQVGPIATDDSYAYLRPETAQGIFVNFGNVLATTGRKLPFGIAQIGKAFRNEITPRNFIFRVREFEQMEIEYFVQPGTEDAWHERWLQARLAWWQAMGLQRDNIEVLTVPPDELAHYSKATYDLMYRYPIGFEEIEGIASRTDYDLGSHSKQNDQLGLFARVMPNPDSVARLTYYDQEQKKHIVPFVIEPSAGVDRGTLAVLSEAYDEQQVKALPDAQQQAVAEALAAYMKSIDRNDKLPAEQRAAILGEADTISGDLETNLPRIAALLDMPGADIPAAKKLAGQATQVLDSDVYRTVLHLKPFLAPITAAVLPLKRNNEQLVEVAQGVRRQLQQQHAIRTIYDDTGAIGKLYRRQDEIGTPFCITVDFDTLGRGDDNHLQNTVTVRDRDSMEQERVPISELATYIRERMQ